MENLTEEEKVAAQYMSDHYEDFYPDINGNQNARSNNQENIDDLQLIYGRIYQLTISIYCYYDGICYYLDYSQLQNIQPIYQNQEYNYQYNDQELEQAIAESQNHQDLGKKTFDKNVFYRDVNSFCPEEANEMSLGSFENFIKDCQNKYATGLFSNKSYTQLLKDAKELDTFEAIDDNVQKIYNKFRLDLFLAIQENYPDAIEESIITQAKEKCHQNLKPVEEANQDLQNIKPRDGDNLEERLHNILQTFYTIKEAVKINDSEINNSELEVIIKSAEKNFTDALEQTLEGLTDNNLDELEKNLADYMAMVDLNNEQSNFNLEPFLNMSSNNQNQYEQEYQDLFDSIDWKQYDQKEQHLIGDTNQIQSKLLEINQEPVNVNNNSTGFGIGVK